MKKWHSLLLAFMTVGLATVLLAGCGKQSSHSGKQINVVSTVNFYGQAAKAVLGSHGTVTSVINNANIDPHSYQPTPATSKQVAKANLVIANGVGYDTWMNTIVKNNPDNTKYIQVGELMNRKSTDNPHLWYDQKTMPKLVTKLATEFGKMDPKHKAAFKTNAQKYIQSLKPIDRIINQQKKVSTDAKVVVSEPVFNYALQAMGYQIADQDFAKAVENETDPSPAAIRNLQNLITHKKIKFFVLNTQTNDKVVSNMVKLAQEHHLPIVRVTETMPNDQKNYKNWMLSQFKQLEQIDK